MATVAEVIQLEQNYVNLANGNISKLEGLLPQLRAINPAAPDATAQADAIIAKWNQFNPASDPVTHAAFQTYWDAYSALSSADKAAVDASSAEANYQTMKARLDSISAQADQIKATLKAAINSAQAAATTPAPAPNSNNLSGTADGDSGSSNKSSNVKQPVGSTGSAETSTVNPRTQKSASSPNTPVSDIEEFVSGNSTTVKPGRRLKNPLGYLASYSYQISLYMITPDAYDAFVATGRKNINVFSEAATPASFASRQSAQRAAGEKTSDNVTGGAFLIAQSGGVGVTNGEKRAPGLDYDLAIDNLTFNHFISPDATQSAVANTEMKFTITEPYGFSFITNLRNAQTELINYAGGKSNLPKNPTKQFFVLGVRFFGWDQSGNPVKGTDVYDGAQLDPNSTGSTLFEAFYDIIITHIRFKLDGKATVYEIEAQPVPTNLAINIRKGFNTSVKEASGRTVSEVLCGPDGFFTKLNLDEKKQANASDPKQLPMKYKIKWVGDASEIANATIKSSADVSKGATPGSTAQTTTNVNDATAVAAQPRVESKKITFGDNQPIVQLIEYVIMDSSFLEDALKVVYTDAPENDPAGTAPNKIKPSYNKAIKWFSITPEISEINWDSKKKDWAFTTTYVIQTYYVPVIDSPVVAKTAKYYGPHKRFDYWYTGKNSEILSYESRLDNTFFVVALENQTESSPSDAPGNANGNPATASPVATGMQSNQVPGGLGQRMSAASNFRTNLSDPAAYALANVEILGDPDFLMQPTSTSINGAFNRFYGTDGFTVNPSGGQVFFEIDFKEAVDYSTSSVNATDGTGRGIQGQGGTLSINDSILFWDYPEKITTPDPETGKPLVQGISYKLRQLTSTFSGGSFKQKLEANINTFNGPSAENSEASRETTTTGNSPQAPAPSNASTSINASPMTDPQVKTSGSASGSPGQSPTPPPQAIET